MALLSILAAAIIKKTVVTTKTVDVSSGKMVLEYIQALTTFPMVTLVIFLIAFLLFRKEIKILIKSLQSFKAPGGFEGVFSSDIVATTAADAALEVEKAALDVLPAGEDRETKTRDLEEKRAAIEERVKAALPPPSIPIVDYAGQQYLFKTAIDDQWKYHGYRNIYETIEPIIKDTVKNYINTTDSKVYASEMGSMLKIEDPEILRQLCVKSHPEVQKYSRRLLMKVINDIAMQYAPVVKVNKMPSF